MKKEVYIIKGTGEKVLFDPSKLANSLRLAGAKKETIEEITTHIERELEDGMSTHAIYEHAFFLLHKIEKPVAARYSLRRAIMELGPTGFPFEDFVGEIFKSKGFMVETDHTVRGKCVEHEIDVVAYNENKLIMVEAKYHNDLNMKSDVKVALYIKARFEDISHGTFNFGKPNRKLDEGWIITNTKFTDSAIAFGKCENIKMVGWNYPEKGNLHDLIEDAGLHPITCLTTLSKNEKLDLLNQGIVLCKYLRDHKNVLTSIGVKEDRIESILHEVNSLYV